MEKETAEQVQLEDRAHEIRRAVLSNEKFMAGIKRSQQEEQSGGEGRAWVDVKRDLGIV